MYQRVNELYESDNIEELLAELKPLIISSIKRYFNDYKNYDDLIQEGNLVILTVLSEQKLESGRHFLGYVKNALRFHYLDKHKHRKETLSLNQNIASADGLELMDLLEDGAPSQEQIILDSETREELNRSLSMLTDNQRNIVIKFYHEKISIQHIAYALNISYRTVVNTKTAAIKKLKEHLFK